MSYLPIADKKRYFAVISKIESGDNPNAKNPLSTASGRFQFLKGTWEGLGFKWADRFNDAVQYQAIEKFTAQNAARLQAANCAINFATLYGAHFLGAEGLLKVMRAKTGAPIDTVTTAAQRKANPTILGTGTVLDFCKWLERKTGDSVYKRYAPDTVIPVEVAPSKPVGWNAPLGAIGVVVAMVAYTALKFFNVI